MINAQFAQANGLKIGDTFSLEIESGKKVAVTVIGEYLTGNESQQEKTTAAVYRMENQIYIDNTTYVNLFDNCGFYKVLAYTGQPKLLDIHWQEAYRRFCRKRQILPHRMLYISR